MLPIGAVVESHLLAALDGTKLEDIRFISDAVDPIVLIPGRH